MWECEHKFAVQLFLISSFSYIALSLRFGYAVLLHPIAGRNERESDLKA